MCCPGSRSAILFIAILSGPAAGFRSVLAGSECYSGRMLLRAGTVAFVFLLALSLHAQQQMPKPQSALVIQGLGQGQVRLNGFWQFHTGDDPRWASPSLDDSAWEPITASGTWGSQDHPGYTGFAWYRRHLYISLAPGANTSYALLIPPVDDAYEVYWNGKLIGGYGKLPPRPHWFYTLVFSRVRCAFSSVRDHRDSRLEISSVVC